MFCKSCRALIEDGALLCSTCGAEVSQGDALARVVGPPKPLRSEPALEFKGPHCASHPGMPLVGACPRCAKEVCIRCAPDAARDQFTCTDCHGLTAAHQTAPLDAMCALHPEQRARFICARCGSFSCSGCAATGLGQAGQCVRCAPVVGVLASRSSRFAANLLDNFILVVPALAMLFVGAAFASSLGGSDAAGPLGLLGLAVGMVLGCGGQLVAQIVWGQSLGKRLLGIKVVRVNGDPIEVWRVVLLRNIVLSAIAQFCGLIGLVDALLIFGTEQRCLHDYLADSIVVEAPRV